jgi:N-acyl-D-amino-acid deacylase
VMGRNAAPPSGPEMSQMKGLIEEGLHAGAIGVSTGLIYEPGRHARTEELIELTSLLRGTGALYTTHMRNEGLGLLDSVDEAICIGRAAGVGVQISHHKASGRDAWGLVGQSLDRIDAAQRAGLDVHADQYPYTAGSTVLSAVADGDRLGASGGGVGALAAADVVIASTAHHPLWEGKSIAVLMAEFELDLSATLRRILDEEPGATVVLHAMNEADVRAVMRHPSTMIGSDGLPTLEGKPHPRLYGTFARVLGHYARDLGVLSMPDAVYKMTGFSAAKFGLRERGVIAPGNVADLVLFDPRTIIDRGTFENPNQTPAGIHSVLVNGEAVVSEGCSTAARPGRTLRRA